MKNNRILAFGPHPDDVEILGAGTLALLGQKGFEIHIAVMAGGEMGSPVLPPAEIHALRMKEAAAAAAVIDGTFHYAGGHDIEIEYDHAYRIRTVRLIRAVDPLIVFTTSPADYLIDHEVTSRLIRNACFMAPVPNYDRESAAGPTESIPHLYYYNAVGDTDIFGRPLPLSCSVNIAPVIETKAAMLACHASQKVWLTHHGDIPDLTASMRDTARKEGTRAGFHCAESFIRHRGSGHPRGNILKEIFGDECREYTLNEAMAHTAFLSGS